MRRSKSAEPETVARKIIGYCHGATTPELTAQMMAVEAFAESLSKPITTYREVRRSGKAPGPAYQQALAFARASGGTLVFGTLGDLAQSTAFLAQLRDTGVSFLVLDDEVANQATLPLMLRLATDHEARSSRIKEALARKRAELRSLAQQDAQKRQGVKLKLGGNPINDAGRLESAHVRKSAANARLAIVVAEVRRLMKEGLTQNPEIAQKLNELGVSRPRGGPWTGLYVSRITARLRRGE